MKLPSYLVRNRFGVFYFRIVFPQLVRDILCKKETRRSLRTHDRKIAILMSREFQQINERVFNKITCNKMNWIETKKLFDEIAENLFQKYVEKVEQVGFNFDDAEALSNVMPEAETFLAPENPETDTKNCSIEQCRSWKIMRGSPFSQSLTIMTTDIVT